jgi:hypothetical protein
MNDMRLPNSTALASDASLLAIQSGNNFMNEDALITSSLGFSDCPVKNFAHSLAD